MNQPAADPRMHSAGQDTPALESIFSVDVEDWFHILDTPGAPQLCDWAALPSRVERNFMYLLDIFSERQIQTTCFFLGWIGERFPHLVREACARGHEVSSHGYGHRLVYQLSRQEFYEDILKSRKLLEDIAGKQVTGHRAPGFSVTESTLWFFEAVAEAGYEYDSSVFPTPRGHRGIRTDVRGPYEWIAGERTLIEFPITVADIAGKPMCFFGGGYLRLFPYALIHRMGRQVLNEGRPVVFYIHPREIDPGHPRLPMPLARRFRSYVNLHTTEAKLNHIFDDFSVTSFSGFLSRHRSTFARCSK